MSQSDSSQLIRFGKGMVAHIYPKVYYDFVICLYKEHDDLLRAMQLAQVRMEDGSALDFLNQILMMDPPVTKQTPMEIGYACLLDALNMRVKSKIVTDAADRFARDAFKHDIDLGARRDSSEHGKPLFPSIEEVEEQAKRAK